MKEQAIGDHSVQPIMCRRKPYIVIIVSACRSYIAGSGPRFLLYDLIRQMNLLIDLIIAKLAHIITIQSVVLDFMPTQQNILCNSRFLCHSHSR
ncbi:hypothetical protein D3C76_1282620 [compost metagenome]